MTAWQQIALGVFVGMAAWQLLSRLLGIFLAVLLRRSPRTARLIAHDQRREEEFRQRVEAALGPPTLRGTLGSQRYG